MEVLGAVAATLDILARSLGLLQQARAAWELQKNGISRLSGLCNDVKSTIALLELVKAETELRQLQVHEAATLVQTRAKALHDVIHDLQKRAQISSGVRKFVDHFLDGHTEQLRLEAMRKDLNDSKSTLILALQMAQVGLMRSMEKGDVIVNIEIVNHINQHVQMCPELRQGLRLAELLRQRGWKDDEGKWHLTDQDLSELEKPPPYMGKPVTRGVVQSNKVDNATFVGMGVGKDGGDEHSVNQPDVLVVTDNTVSGGALFMGGGISASNLVYLARNIPGFAFPMAAPTQQTRGRH